MSVLWGHMSPQMLQKIMYLFAGDLKLYESGALDMEHVKKLASLGSSGSYPNNCWAELKRLLPKPKLPKLHYVWLPMKHNVLGRFWRHVPMMLPHELFGAIYNLYPEMWKKIVCPGRETCQRFWAAVAGHDKGICKIEMPLCLFVFRN